ncbi:hypothetical protein [Wolbachia endosymbiont of Encarsia formosa]
MNNKADKSELNKKLDLDKVSEAFKSALEDSTVTEVLKTQGFKKD